MQTTSVQRAQTSRSPATPRTITAWLTYRPPSAPCATTPSSSPARLPLSERRTPTSCAHMAGTTPRSMTRSRWSRTSTTSTASPRASGSAPSPSGPTKGA